VQKIIIKNFGPIKDAEIEIKKTLILIGEQASGKSTIAKLIYFFRTLPEELMTYFFEKVLLYGESKIFTNSQDILESIRNIFNNYFEQIHGYSNFNIKFYYKLEDNKFISFDIDKNGSLTAKFDTKSTKHFNQLISKFNNDTQLPKATFLRLVINSFFQNFSLHFLNEFSIDNFYMIAGRSLTVGYSRTFEKYLFAELSNSSNKNNKSINEILTQRFIKRIDVIKEVFEKVTGKGSLKKLMSLIKHTDTTKHTLNAILEKANFILKGKYELDGDSEYLLLNGLDEKYVLLKNASTGQQEVIRVLQDLFLSTMNEKYCSRVIEEPEAHLFPEAQKLLVEIFARFVNNLKMEPGFNQMNSIIITTHSPYILTAYNNLLFANRVIQKNEALKAEVLDIVDEHCLLDSKDFSAYGLKIVQNEGDVYCRSIVDAETGLIDQNFLDSVSDTLNAEFQALYSLHTKTFARK